MKKLTSIPKIQLFAKSSESSGRSSYEVTFIVRGKTISAECACKAGSHQYPHKTKLLKIAGTKTYNIFLTYFLRRPCDEKWKINNLFNGDDPDNGKHWVGYS